MPGNWLDILLKLFSMPYDEEQIFKVSRFCILRFVFSEILIFYHVTRPEYLEIFQMNQLQDTTLHKLNTPLYKLNLRKKNIYDVK